MKIRCMLILGCFFLTVPADSVALTVEEILLLKQNGVSEQTIQMMLQSERQDKLGPTAEEKVGVKTIQRPGGRSAIAYSTVNGVQDTREAEARLKEERAWEMLRRIIVDTRPGKTGGRYP